MKWFIFWISLTLFSCQVDPALPSFTVEHPGEYYVFLSNDNGGDLIVYLTWGENKTKWIWPDVEHAVGPPGDVEIAVSKVIGPGLPDGVMHLELTQGDVLTSDVAPIGDPQALVTWRF